MQRIRQLISEAHRRSLWQVLGIYILGSWAAYEIILGVQDQLGLPDWVAGFALVLFLIGLPIVLATAFVQEGLPGQSAFSPDPRSAGPADPTLVPGLDTAEPRPEQHSPAPALLTPARPHFFLTWQRSVLAGITAFLLLGITAGGYVGLRNAGVGPFASLITSGALDARDRLIVAQLEHTAGDTITAAAITEALRVDLAQSPVVTVLEARFIGDALQRMGRSRDERLDGALAREVAIREGAKAVLEGEVSPAGSGYILTVRLLRASTGELLVTHRETAADDDEIIAAVDRMSKKLRAMIGESLRTVRADAPLEKVTTGSLIALQRYTQGARAMDMERDYDRSIQLLQEAVAEDSTFAMAWRKLAVVYYNTRAGRARIDHAARRAYELRDRLTERERYHTIAFYHLNITLDNSAAIGAYRTLLDLYPDDHAALNNLALTYGRVRDFDRAADHFRRAVAVDSFVASTWTNLAVTEYRRGNRAESRAVLEEATRRFPQHLDNRGFAAAMAQAEGDYAESERILHELLAESRGSDVWRARLNLALANLRAMSGRGAQAREFYLQAMSADASRGVRGTDLAFERRSADWEQWVLQRPDLAVGRLDAMLTSAAWRDTPAESRGHLHVADIYARSGRPDQARELIAEWDALPEQQRAAAPWARNAAMGWIAIAEGRPADAVPAMRQATSSGECVHCGLPALATAFEAAGMPDSAIVHYRRYIETPAMTRLNDDALDLARSYERLAELYEAAGDMDSARRYAVLFVELWKNADPELQPRVRAKQALLQQRVQS